MFQKIEMMIQSVSKTIDANPFLYGIVTGLLLAVLVLFLLLLCLHRKSLSKLILKSGNEEIVVSVKAVRDVIQHVLEADGLFSMKKASFSGKETAVKIVLCVGLKANLETLGEPFSVLAEGMQAKIQQSLKDTFGLDKIESVKLHLTEVNPLPAEQVHS